MSSVESENGSLNGELLQSQMGEMENLTLQT